MTLQDTIQEVVEQYLFLPNTLNTHALIAEELEEAIKEESGEEVRVTLQASADNLNLLGKVFIYCTSGEDVGECQRVIRFNVGPLEG